MARKFFVSFSERSLRAVDAAARTAGESRSEFLLRAARAELRRLEALPRGAVDALLSGAASDLSTRSRTRPTSTPSRRGALRSPGR
ncbi:MAG: ribbon-helix-helix protein, CopG family [Deltaproteobacteria bacterium]|nr:MAG: ribbon-helix-helix protein, CopG family [Deltaproteobacteria bacterium]